VARKLTEVRHSLVQFDHFEPQGSGQNRPCGVASKPAIWDGPERGPYLSRFLLIRQVRFGSPAPWAALQDVSMME
jgi:hypothetical protein